MSIGIVMVTHEEIGSALLEQARQILDDTMAAVWVVEVTRGRKTARQTMKEHFARADLGSGVLILTDLPGATPSNIALETAGPENLVLSGLNLPMLIRAWNYRESPLEKVAALALDGARSSIMEIH